MARFVHIEHPATHGGIVRFSRGFNTVASWNATHLVLGALALIGSPVTAAAAALRSKVAAWSAGREQRRQDEKLWSIALSDARVMADLSRAMSREAARDVRGFY